MALYILEDKAHLLLVEVAVLHRWSQDLAMVPKSDLTYDSQLLERFAVVVKQLLLVGLCPSLLLHPVTKSKTNAFHDLFILCLEFVLPNMLPVRAVLPSACGEFTLFQAPKLALLELRMVTTHMSSWVTERWHRTELTTIELTWLLCFLTRSLFLHLFVFNF